MNEVVESLCPFKMAVDEIKQTSEQHMRRLQFNDKVSRLNREFIRRLQEWYKECAHYDFSTSVKSYLGHIKRLDEMYFGKVISNDVSRDSPKLDRKIAKAKRRVTDVPKTNELNSSISISTPSGAPPRFSIEGTVSAIKPNVDVASNATAVESSTSVGISRKRAIRGGGPSGGAETVVFRGKDSSDELPAHTEVPSAVPFIAKTLPKPTPGFWSSQKRDVDCNENHSSVASNNGSLFSLEKKKNEGPESPSTSTKSNNGDVDSGKKQTLSFPSFPAANDKEKIGQNTFSFGNTTTNNASTGGLTFSFGTLPKSSSEGEKAQDDEKEYVPPKPEVVENEEADAVFSTKCSVFKLIDKQYSKIGIGMLHLKEVDGKKSVLVRAATAIGTVWINAFMNKAMKAAKVDEKGEKIRLSYPASEKEILTYVIRFPSAKEASRFLEDIEAATKEP